MQYQQVVSIAFLLVFLGVARAIAQDQPPQQQTPAPPAEHQHDHGTMGTSLFAPREASGTAWLPADDRDVRAARSRRSLGADGHGNAFLQFLHEAANEHRGSTQAGSINWLMLMARREVGPARVGLRTMVSLEPATIGDCGYPDLLATGELCESGFDSRPAASPRFSWNGRRIRTPVAREPALADSTAGSPASRRSARLRIRIGRRRCRIRWRPSATTGSMHRTSRSASSRQACSIGALEGRSIALQRTGAGRKPVGPGPCGDGFVFRPRVVRADGGTRAAGVGWSPQRCRGGRGLAAARGRRSRHSLGGLPAALWR